MRTHFLTATALMLSLLMSASASATSVLAESTFASSAEDWTAAYFNTVVPLPVLYKSGAIHVQDLTDGDTFYWNAPAAFLGDKEAAFGGSLRWQAKDTGTGTFDLDGTQAVQLVGMIVDEPVVIYCPCATMPGRSSYVTLAVTLSAEGGCWLSNGAIPDPLTFEAVLSNLVVLQVKAEYLNGVDTASMDSITLSTP